MKDIQVNIAVVDGKDPRNWMVLNQGLLGEFVDNIGTISALSEGYLENKRISVDVLLDDVATLQDGQCRAISGIMIDGDLLLQYALDTKNPCLARLQRVLKIMSQDKAAAFRQFGLRVWIVGTDAASYKHRQKIIIEKIMFILQVKLSEICVQYVKSLQVAQEELKHIAEEVALKEDFVSLEIR